MLKEHERYSDFGMNARSGNRMLKEHERYSDFGMDLLVIVCFRNTNVIMILAWMLW